MFGHIMWKFVIRELHDLEERVGRLEGTAQSHAAVNASKAQALAEREARFWRAVTFTLSVVSLALFALTDLHVIP